MHAAETANADEGSKLEWAAVYADDAGAARLKTPKTWKEYAR